MEPDLENAALLVATIATLFGLWRGIMAWRKVARASIAAQVLQQQTIEDIAEEFKPRNGRTLAHTVADIDREVSSHSIRAEAFFAENEAAHADIHRRIDGLFELFGASGITGARRAAERHRRDVGDV